MPKACSNHGARSASAYSSSTSSLSDLAHPVKSASGLSGNLAIRTAVSLLLLLGLLFVGLAGDVSAQTNGSSQPSIESVLDENGRVKPGMSGSFDPRGFKMTYGPNGEPVFQRGEASDARSAAMPSTTDNPQQVCTDRWDSRGSNGTNGTVSAIAVSGSDVYVGGAFTVADGVAANNIAKWNGSSWSALGTGVDGTVLAIAISGSDVYVGGGGINFAGGVQVSGVAKWDGSSWSALGTGVVGIVAAIAVSGSHVYVGGGFNSAGGVAVSNIAKWDGSSWSSLGSGANLYVSALAVMGDQLFAGGDFTLIGGVSANHIARWDGQAWSPLGSGTTDEVFGLAVSGSDLYVAGRFGTAGGVTVRNVAKWDGNSWSAFGDGVIGQVNEIALSGSTIYVAGQVGGGVRKWDGVSWSQLGPELDGTASAVAVAGNNLFVGGAFSSANGTRVNGILRWSENQLFPLGQLPVFDVGGPSRSVSAVAVFGSDVYVGGYFSQIGEVSVNYIARWNGSSWSALGSGTNGRISAMSVVGSDLYVGGDFQRVGDVDANRIARWNGSSWSSLGTGLNGQPTAIAVMGSDVYVAGISNAGGVAVNNIARWNGFTWTTLGLGTNGPVNALAVLGSELLVGGMFETAGGVNVKNIAKWNGNAWSSLGTSALGNGGVNAIAVIGSDVYVGGGFNVIMGSPANNVAKWNGTSWSALGSGTNGTVNALSVIGSDLYVGGEFTSIGEISAKNIAKWDGNSWATLGNGVNGQVFSLASSGTDLYVGGLFSSANCSTSSVNFARYYGEAFTGAQDSNWHTAGNWNSGTVPDRDDNIVVTSGSVQISDADAHIRDLQVNQGATLTVAPGRRLFVHGSLEVRGTLTGAVELLEGCTPFLSPSSRTVGEASGTGSVSVTVKNGCQWSATSNSPFITTTSSGTGDGTLQYTYATHPANAGGTPRTGTVTVAGQVFTLQQSGCAVTLGQSGASGLGASGATGSVSVSADANCSWEASSNSSWVSVNPQTTGGTAGGTVQFSVQANPGPARTGSLTIGGKTFTISQESGCSYTLSSLLSSVGSASGSGTFTVNAFPGCGWSAVSNSSWINVTSGGSGSGTDAVAFSFQANEGPARTGTITAAGQTFTVSQATGCSVTLTGGSPVIPSVGGAGGFNVNAVGTCGWTASTTSNWISITQQTGSGSGTVAFSVARNTGETSRTGTISVEGQSFTVTQEAPGPCIAVSAPTREAVQGATVSLPLTVGDLTGRNVTAFDIELEFDPTVLRPASTSVDQAGTIAQGFTITTNASQTGRLIISGFGVSPLSGSGTLLNAVFEVIGDNQATTAVGFRSLGFNEGDPCATGTAGSVTVSNKSIAGNVRYHFAQSGQSALNVAGVTLSAQGSRAATAVTVSDGSFLLENLGTGAYTVTASRGGTELSGISSLDASYIAQYVVGIRSLTANQMIAADTSNSGTVTSFDASRLAQSVVGIANPGITGTWKFVPPTRTYETVAGAVTGQDFEAVLVGDVTGNWAPPASAGASEAEGGKSVAEAASLMNVFQMPDVPALRNAPSVRSRMRSASAVVGETVTLPVEVGDLGGFGVTAFDLAVTYDPEVLEPVFDSPVENIGTMSTNFTVVANTPERGRLLVAAYGIAPMWGEGTMLNLRFRVIGSKGDSTKVRFDGLRLNEGETRVELEDGEVRIGSQTRTIRRRTRR